MHDVDDGELINQASEGHAEAMSELYRRHHPTAMRYGKSLTRSGAQAEDLAAEAFTRTWARMQRGTRPRNFLAYVARTMRNLQVDQLRRGRPSESLESASLHTLGDPALVIPDPSNDLVDRLTMHRALASLTPRHRQILLLTVVDGHDYQAVASLLGINVSAVGSLSWRARRALVAAYAEHTATTESPSAQLALNR